MRNGVDHLSATIAAHLREWEPAPAFVELAIFETDDPPTIAQMLAAFCLKLLGAPVRRGLFHQSSIGSVTGIELADDRAVVVKAHQPERSHGLLSEIVRIQSYLSKNGIFAPPILAGPVTLGRGFAIVEQFCSAGVTADAHDARVRRALAGGLFRVVKACDVFVSSTSLEPALVAPTGAALWPKPHSKLFDFAATTRGAEWIDEVAALARERMTAAGRRVIGHGDWRQEHVRFVGSDPMVAFDWDSLCCQPEPILIGVNAHGFCADWSRANHAQAPTIQEARSFKGDYEAARGMKFSPDENRLCGAAFAYACAYTARCGHAGGTDERAIPGTFQYLVWNERQRLLDL